MAQILGTNALGGGTYTVWVSSCGLSACSGNTGCGGSPMGTQPRDLLMAWLSFLAGDFCKEGRTNKGSVTLCSHRCHRVGMVETGLSCRRGDLHYEVNCLFYCVKSVDQQWFVYIHCDFRGSFDSLQYYESIILHSYHLKTVVIVEFVV